MGSTTITPGPLPGSIQKTTRAAQAKSAQAWADYYASLAMEASGSLCREYQNRAASWRMVANGYSREEVVNG